MNKKEEKVMCNKIADMFGKVLDTLCLSSYTYEVYYDKKADDDEVFAIQLNHPYRAINLYIATLGKKHYEDKDWDIINRYLIHETFHIIHWKYKLKAKNRFTTNQELDDEEEDMADKFTYIVSNLLDSKNTLK